MQDLAILYRGPLSSCDYACHYCPFAKRHETAAELRVDRTALERFVDWAAAQEGWSLSIFFTPWGEALIRRWYHGAMSRLSYLPHVRRVAVQTNLSCSLDWIAACDVAKVGLWCTFHPSQVARRDFLAQCRRLDELPVRYSVGVVGLREHFEEIERLRAELAPHVYLWVNAYKDEGPYYSPDDISRLEEIDPLFRINLRRHPSWQRPCRAGESVISVDGQGHIRRCHFIGEVIGSLYQPDWQAALRPRACTNVSCGCHIGYVHLPELGLYDVFGDGVLERVPSSPLWRAAEPRAAALTLAERLTGCRETSGA